MRNKILKTIISLIAGFFILFVFLPGDFFSKKEVLFTIEKGEGSKEIAENLQKAGLIDWSYAFRFYALVSGQAGKLQAGIYNLDSRMNVPEIAGIISEGRIATDKFTIIEGWTLRDMADYFEEKGFFSSSDFYEVTGNLLDPHSLEGYLFPDTYLLAKGSEAQAAVDLMKVNFQRKMSPYLSEIEEQGKTVAEVITMASLIEKEVKTMEDKKIVSGILWKRIRYGYPLQIDASIAYVKGVSQWRYSLEDTKIESPYNTYLNYGLPPGPISSPGLDSIEAALSPTESPYLYYLSTPEGETIYSKTLEEHNEAIERYLK
jgi:UPF0755 protein